CPLLDLIAHFIDRATGRSGSRQQHSSSECNSHQGERMIVDYTMRIDLALDCGDRIAEACACVVYLAPDLVGCLSHTAVSLSDFVVSRGASAHPENDRLLRHTHSQPIAPSTTATISAPSQERPPTRYCETTMIRHATAAAAAQSVNAIPTPSRIAPRPSSSNDSTVS